MEKFESLYEFIDRAVKNRKYPPNTAQGLKAALKIFEAEINEEERASLKKFKENLDQIYLGVSTKNKDITQSSLLTYKTRVNKVMRDYEQYGIDPTKMANWSVKTIVRQKKQKSSENKTNDQSEDRKSEVDALANFVFEFRGGVKLVIPRNQATSDAIADGELKAVRMALTKFAEEFMSEENENEEDAS